MTTESVQTLLCPACGCRVVNGGFEKDGVRYCCEACASSSACQCGCCHPEQ